ncbi:SSI family serine proteinase inhibitor [Actinocorallia populi]|uniref:SSI family serine proteinase inhibitor n=1 Tax=Actinocorallia populi TaxID=2079200 RepID=UPI000D0974C7|nr:SSI family serine proteinase inhibitor [Actinocorallia populi]
MPRSAATALLLTTATLVAAGACGAQKAETGDSTVATSASSPAAQVSRLTITLKKSPTSAPQTWTLTCNPPGGDHPAPKKACAQLAKTGAKAFAPPPSDAVCTEIYGGPEQGTVEGVWRGAKVHATYQRKDGCDLDRWSRVSELFGELPRVR